MAPRAAAPSEDDGGIESGVQAKDIHRAHFEKQAAA
jgi:hypothetical protein